MGNTLEIILWFHRPELNACLKHILQTAVAESEADHITISTVDPPDASEEELRTSQAILERLKVSPHAWVWTDVSFQPQDHMVADDHLRVYFVNRFADAGFVFFVWSDKKTYHHFCSQYGWRSSQDLTMAIPVSLRCPSRSMAGFYGCGLGIDDVREMLARLSKHTERCGRACCVGKDPKITSHKPQNWEVLMLDDQVLKSHILGIGDSVMPEHFKYGDEAEDLVKSVRDLRSILPGTWHMGGTETACQMICSRQRLAYDCREFPLLHDPVYGFENYDVVLLDVLFDLRMAADIQLVPLIKSMTQTPLYVFSSAGRYSTHGESSLYYANRAIRLGANGYINKPAYSSDVSSARAEICRIEKLLCLALDHREWHREWRERFAGTADSFLGGKSGQLVKRLEKSAKEEDGTSVASAGVEIDGRLECFKYLLCKLFEDCDRIEFAKDPSAGVGAGTKFFVTPIRHGRRDNDKLVKLGPYDSLQFEERNYRTCISGYLDTFVGQICRPMVRADQYAGIVYSSVGYSANSDTMSKDLRDLADLVRQSVERGESKEHIARLLEELDHAFFSRLYRERAVVSARRLKNATCTNAEDIPNGPRRTERSAIRFIKHHCGISSVAEWWRKEYLDLLPPVQHYTFEGDGVKIEPVPPSEREFAGVSSKENRWYITGRLEDPKGTTAGQTTLRLIDPFSHRRISVAYPERHQADGLILSYGKWIRVSGDGEPHLRGVIDNIEQYLASAARNALPKRCEPVTSAYLPLLKNLKNGNAQHIVGTSSWDTLDALDSFCKGVGYYPPEDGKAFSLPMTVSTVHGDLNTGNILVGSAGDESESRNYWLIDFEKTHLYGHLARDFAKLESDVRQYVVSKVLMDSALMRFLQGDPSTDSGYAWSCIRASLNTQKAVEKWLWEGTSISCLPAEVAAAYRWISGLRSLATDRYGIGLEELKLSVFLHSMKSITFSKTYSNPKQEPYGYFPRFVHYVAATALKSDVERIVSGHSSKAEGDAK